MWRCHQWYVLNNLKIWNCFRVILHFCCSLLCFYWNGFLPLTFARFLFLNFHFNTFQAIFRLINTKQIKSSTEYLKSTFHITIFLCVVYWNWQSLVKRYRKHFHKQLLCMRTFTQYNKIYAVVMFVNAWWKTLTENNY